MPNGRSSPSANTSAPAELRPSGAGCRTDIRPPRVSVTKMSPLGATIIRRGPRRSEANNPISKPGGTFACAYPGLGISLGGLRAEEELKGAGRFARSILCVRPGASCFHSASDADAVAPAGVAPGDTFAAAAFTLRKYWTRSARLVLSSTDTTMAVPGTAFVGDARNRFRLRASHVNFESLSALV